MAGGIGTRHTEFFGPDFARGPFSGDPLQIATALAQLRMPLLRSDSELESHAEFISTLAEKLAPDQASMVRTDVGNETANAIDTSIRVDASRHYLLHCWLTDTTGGGATTVSPDTVTWNTGVVLSEEVTKRRFLIVTSATGVANVTVQYTGIKVWRWAVALVGRVFYSSQLFFD